MRLVFFGSPDFAVPSLEALLREHQVLAVVTQPDKPKGRGQESAAPPVKTAALKAGVPVLQPASVRKPPFAPELARLAPEIAVVVAYGKILPPELLSVPPRGCINVHASLLPRWRGAAPIQWAILFGDPVTGITTMQMDAGMDTGQILLTCELAIAPEETAGSLFNRLAPLGAELALETLRGLTRGDLQPRPQEPTGATHARLLTKEDGRLDWNRPARELERQVRGMDPWPGAFTLAAGKILKVRRVALGAAVDGPPGRLGPGAQVACGEGSLLLLELQPEGKNRMSGLEWTRGHRLDRLGS